MNFTQLVNMKEFKYELGGALASIAIDLVGSQVKRIAEEEAQANALRDNFNTIKVSTNPYGYEDGGKLKGSHDNATYVGKPHSQDGIKVNSEGIPTKNTNQEVEGDEVKVDLDNQTYIFSKKLII